MVAAASLTTIAPLIVLAGALVALATALINHRTATDRGRTPPPEFPPREPKLFLPRRPDCIDREHTFVDAIARFRAGVGALVLEGGPGVGKSTAATELAYRLHLHEHTNGTLDLRGHSFFRFDAGNGCPSLARICSFLTLRTKDQSLSGAPQEAKLEALHAHLATNRTVLLFDDLNLAEGAGCEPVRELVRTVPNGSYVIASVNGPGDLDAARVHLPDLALDDVRDLIRQTADRLGLDSPEIFDEGFAPRLVDVVGGNPRVIEWFLLALRDTSKSMDALFAAVARGEGLQDFFAPIWNELPEKSMTVLGACAHLCGRTSAEQLATACALTEDNVSRALDELIRLRLVTMDRSTDQPAVFTCSPAVRTFVLSLTPKATRNYFTDALAAHYTRYFGENWEDARAAVPHVSAIVPTLEDLRTRGKDDDLQALFEATLDILFTLGLFDDRIDAGRLAHESAVLAENHRAASLAASVLSSTYAIRGELAEAREAYTLGSLAAESSGLPGEKARQMREAGFLCYRSGRAKDAIIEIQGADGLARRADDLRNLVDILSLRTCAHWYVGDLELSGAAARTCLEVCEQIPWERGKAYPLRDLAEIAIHNNQPQVARERLERARAIAHESEDRRQLARVDLTEARMHLLGGDLPAARRAALDAEAQADELRLPPERREARAIRVAASVASFLLPVRLYYAWRRPLRLTSAPVGGD